MINYAKILLITFFSFFSFNLSAQHAELEQNFELLPALSDTKTISSNLITTRHTQKPKYVRGIHLSGWAAGSKKLRTRYDEILANSEINTLVIAVKEASGEVFIKNIAKAEKIGAFRNAMPDIKTYIEYLHSKNVYVIARIVLFKDPIFATHEPSMAVKNIDGNIWKDYKGLSWIDPFNKKGWEYNFSIVDECVNLGFDEIQFDYVRFPSDGIIKNCRYAVNYSTTAAVNILAEFLKEAQKRYKEKLGINISVDVFGLTTSAMDDLGIGQIIESMEPYVDAIYPMVYPSHYRNGTYNIKIPNQKPYETVFNALKEGKKKLGDKSYKFRPYIQDFSLGYKYGVKEIRDQIQALYDNDIAEWILWDPKALYTREALHPKSEMNKYEKKLKPQAPPPQIPQEQQNASVENIN